jgi:hypothetical protein
MAVSNLGGSAGAVLLVSGNGGEPWSSVQAHGLPAAEEFIGLACPRASECWMSGDAPVRLRAGLTVVGDTGGAVVVSSANGGRTWQNTGLPKGISGIGALSCPSPSTCFAMAFNGPAVSSSGRLAIHPSLALLAYTGPRR